MTMDTITNDQYIDEEWVTLVKEALLQGISGDEIRAFLRKKQGK